MLQLWSSKWSIKDEHKLLSELGGNGTNGSGNGGGGGGGGGGNSGGGGGGGGGGGSGYYEHSGFPGNAIATSAELYDSLGTISTMTQAQTPHLYTPPIGGTIGERSLSFHPPAPSDNPSILSAWPLSLYLSICLAISLSPFLPSHRNPRQCVRHNLLYVMSYTESTTFLRSLPFLFILKDSSLSFFFFLSLPHLFSSLYAYYCGLRLALHTHIG